MCAYSGISVTRSICNIILRIINVLSRKDDNKMKVEFGDGKLFPFGAVVLLPFKSIVFIGCLFFVGGSYAETASSDNLLKQYKQLVTEQQKEFEKQRQIIAEQGKQLEQLKLRLDTLTNQTSGLSNKLNQPQDPSVAENEKGESAALPNQSSSRPIEQSLDPSNKADKSQNQDFARNNTEEPTELPNQLPSEPVGQAPPQSKEPQKPPEMPRLSEAVGGVLTRKGKFVIEPSLQYAFTSNNRVFLDAFTFLPAIAIGLIDLRQVDRHAFIGALGTRFGVTDRLELEFRVPYVYRSDEQRSRPVSIGAGVDETFNATGSNIGDLQFTGRYQLTNGSGGMPILVGNITTTVPTGKSPFDVKFEQAQGVPGAAFPTEVPTGAGYFSVQPSITALYPTDPAVFFANILYGFNASTKEKILGNAINVNPGDAVGATFGMGFAINSRSSFNLGYSHRHLFNSKINGNTIGGSKLDIGQLLVGYSFRYSQRTNFNLSLGVGTTDDAQDMRLNFRMPMVF